MDIPEVGRVLDQLGLESHPRVSNWRFSSTTEASCGDSHSGSPGHCEPLLAAGRLTNGMLAVLSSVQDVVRAGRISSVNRFAKLKVGEP